MRSASFDRLGRLVGASVALLGATACVDHPVKGVEYPWTIVHEPDPPRLPETRSVDVLFVIDNSASMAEEQATLAANFASFIEVLERPEVAANYRIGVTTTDNGNPWCAGTSPEAGQLQLSSCRSRPDAFVFEGEETIDAREEACYAVCPEQWSEIEIQPTEILGEDGAQPRPWIERIDGATNLPEGLSPAQAFQCMGPQGIDGCGFESPLESMWKAVRRSQTDGDAAFGFIRPDAILSVVHVTDEVDCSFHGDHESIFLPEGGRVFWSDQDAASPTSAVCWNAGVACNGTGPYDCHAVDLDVNGNHVREEDAEELAVLRPLSRYVELLQDVENFKQHIDPEQQVLVALIGGVRADGSVVYRDAWEDSQFQQDFGIGPGCTSDNGRAVPPVRLRELAETFAVDDQQNMFSICDGDYSAALEAIAETIAAQVRPACFLACAADDDPDTPDVLDPSCTVEQRSSNDDGSIEEIEVPECEPDDGVPEHADVCWVPMVGDERSDWCAEAGFNLEIRLVRRAGVPAPKSASISALCALSQDKATDCPELL